jgi:hypothetical protein
MKDSQRSKLYKVERIWERQFTKENGGGKELEFKDSREASNYATWIWINFKMKIYPVSSRKQVSRVKCTPVKGGTSTCWSGYYESKSGSWYKKITLSKWAGHNAFTVIHEMAHALCPRHVHHGPEFVKCFMFLLAHYLNYNIGEMCRIANEHNLQFDSKCTYLNTKFNQLVRKDIEQETKKLSA